MKIKHHTPKNRWVKEEITREIKNYLKTYENKNTMQVMGFNKSNAKRKTYRYINIYIKRNRSQINYFPLTP